MSKRSDPEAGVIDDLDATDPILQACRTALSDLDVDRIASQRIRARAQQALAAPPRPALRWLSRWLEPAVVAGLATGYLLWAIGAVLAVYQ